MFNYSNNNSFNKFKNHYEPISLAYRDLRITESKLINWKEEQLRRVIKHVQKNSPF